MDVETIIGALEQHGLGLYFGLGFAEFVGVPIASTPLLVAGGALARVAEGVHPLAMIPAAAAGGLLADGVLFALVRWKGDAVVDAACGLWSNPSACVLMVESEIRRVGPAFIVVSKLVPGAGNLVGPAAALTSVSRGRFLFYDGLALLTWATVYTSLGWLLSAQVEPALAWVTGYARLALPVALGAMLLSAGLRLARVKRHAKAHARARGGDPLPSGGQPGDAHREGSGREKNGAPATRDSQALGTASFQGSFGIR
jgi:membrane protein DedA with SNARE-associated domain